MLRKAQIEAQNFVLAALKDAAAEATKIQEFFNPAQAEAISKGIISENTNKIRGMIPNPLVTASFKTSSFDELNELRERIKETYLTEIMTAFQEIYTALKQDGQPC
ncbi:MAG: hypothetical protein IE914_06140 [Thiotrichales bacterium]|nr:hypothetical protein [Thiotrichales bacterium]